jgi:Arc/MetJ-type ribon-helix-helix transcriptional regulator
MRTTQIMTISLPPAMVRQFEEVRKRESRTRSELVREALRAYFEERYPAVTPTKAELAALRRGRAAFRRGDSLSLRKFLDGLEPPTRRARTKGLSKASAKRSSAR